MVHLTGGKGTGDVVHFTGGASDDVSLKVRTMSLVRSSHTPLGSLLSVHFTGGASDDVSRQVLSLFSLAHSLGMMSLFRSSLTLTFFLSLSISLLRSASSLPLSLS